MDLGKLDWKLEEVESCMFHGTDHVEDIWKNGFSSSQVNLNLNKYDAGMYLVRNPRLARYCIRELRRRSGAEFK